MRCVDEGEVDLAAFAVDRDAPEWDEFRAHYPHCVSCSAAVAEWAEIDVALEAASEAGGVAHPAEAELLAFARSPEELDAVRRSALQLHVDGCGSCSTQVRVAQAFDANAFRGELGLSPMRLEAASWLGRHPPCLTV